MTRDDIIKMAKEAWLVRTGCVWTEPQCWSKAELVRFAELVAAAEREKVSAWVGLTDAEVSEIIDREIGFNSCFGREESFARAIEAKLKKKNSYKKAV